jgi:hypothetical protein
MKSILIIAFKFPPMGGIGTRRWAKFAKYLSNNGYKVHVITIDYLNIDKVNWISDVEPNENIIIHRIKSGYINFLLKENKTIVQKVLAKILRVVLHNTFFYIDIGQNWAKYLIPYASKLIKKENIENVIVTSPPHSVAYYATYLKVQYPEINLIQDFRDNWNDDEYYEYKKGLRFFWQKEKSAYMENFTVEHSDYLINVTEDISKRTINKYKLYKDKFKTIYNGFDRDDIKHIGIETISDDNKIKIIYAGSLDGRRIKALYLIFDSLLMKKNIKLLDQFELNIYSSYSLDKVDLKYKQLLNKVVFFHSFVSPTQIMKLINEHNYCLSINSPLYPYAFGTKVFDYMMLNKKIIHISGEGELSILLRELNQYVADYNLNSIENLILKIHEEINHDNNKDYERFNLVNLTKDFERLFI